MLESMHYLKYVATTGYITIIVLINNSIVVASSGFYCNTCAVAGVEYKSSSSSSSTEYEVDPPELNSVVSHPLWLLPAKVSQNWTQLILN